MAGNEYASHSAVCVQVREMLQGEQKNQGPKSTK